MLITYIELHNRAQDLTPSRTIREMYSRDTENTETPVEEHHISSPIWECSIQAIEVFFPEDEGEIEWMPVCIERISPLEVWYSDPDACCTDAFVKLYTTKDIKEMIGNNRNASKEHRRYSTRRSTSYHADEGYVCSVRVWYGSKQMFLDRGEAETNHWSREALTTLGLSTERIKSMLSYGGR